MNRLATSWALYHAGIISIGALCEQVVAHKPTTLHEVFTGLEIMVEAISRTTHHLKRSELVLPTSATEQAFFARMLQGDVPPENAGLLSRLQILHNAEVVIRDAMSRLMYKLHQLPHAELFEADLGTPASQPLQEQALDYISDRNVPGAAKVDVLWNLAQALAIGIELSTLTAVSLIDTRRLSQSAIPSLVTLASHGAADVLVTFPEVLPALRYVSPYTLEYLLEEYEAAWLASTADLPPETSRAIIADPSAWCHAAALGDICVISRLVLGMRCDKQLRAFRLPHDFWAPSVEPLLTDFPTLSQFPVGVTPLRHYDAMRQAIGFVDFAQTQNPAADEAPGKWVQVLLDDLAISLRIPSASVLPRLSLVHDRALSSLHDSLFQRSPLHAMIRIDAMSPQDRGILTGSYFRLIHETALALQQNRERTDALVAAGTSLAKYISLGTATTAVHALLLPGTLQHAMITGGIQVIITLLQELWRSPTARDKPTAER